MKKVLAIINPISGVGSKKNIPELLANEYSSQEAPELFITYSKYPGHSRELAKAAVEQGYYMVIAVGGDGTVNEIASALTDSDCILGIVPEGSGNGLSRALGLPNNTKKAIQVLRSGWGHNVTIDCCSINGTKFFCTCGLGYDAAVSLAFAQKKQRGKLTYAYSMIEEFLKFEPAEYSIAIDDEPAFQTKAFLITAANASQYGNNAYIAPEARLSDGLIDLVVIKPFDKILGPKVIHQLFNKSIQDLPNIIYQKARKIIIERIDEQAPVHLDGEPLSFDKKLEINIIPKALHVRIPINTNL